jgi:hypothetical protein
LRPENAKPRFFDFGEFSPVAGFDPVKFRPQPAPGAKGGKSTVAAKTYRKKLSAM